jgi:hypothetical protein
MRKAAASAMLAGIASVKDIWRISPIELTWRNAVHMAVLHSYNPRQLFYVIEISTHAIKQRNEKKGVRGGRTPPRTPFFSIIFSMGK